VELLQIVESVSFDAQWISACAARISAVVLETSEYLDSHNFSVIHPDDLKLLFAEYDARFFDGQIKASLGAIPLSFGLSRRMTSAGGKTVSYTDRITGSRRFEIAISTTMLFGCFRKDDHRPITASGIECRNRLDALLRVMEHEIVHLVEMLLWQESSCRQERFGSITRRFFGHTENCHRLITPKERAVVQFGIKPGVTVRFRFDGEELTGIVNRVNQRATVLVESADGQRYNNGKHYTKFYVPVQSLKPIQ
jgi:hypothetical protein